MIKIYNANKELVLTSKIQLDLKIEHELDNGDKTLSFLVPFDSKESEALEHEGYIETKTAEFVVKEINKNYNSFNVIAKLNLEEFEGKPHKSFMSINATIEQAINLAIVGTGWIVGYSNITKKRTVKKEKVDTLDLIQHIKKIYNAEIIFNTLEKKIYIYEKIGSYKGSYIREKINLTNLSAQADSYDFYTRVEAEGADGLTFADINEGKSYVEDYSYSNKIKTYYWKDERYTVKENLLEDARIKLEELSKPRFSYSVDMVNLINEGKQKQSYDLGDTIELVSKKLRVKELQRIVKLIEFPNTPEKNYVELSNALYSIEDINNKFEDTTETVENITNQDGTVDGSMVDSIDAEKVKNLDVTVKSLTADKVTTGELNAVIANVAELNATKLSVTDANIKFAEIDTAIITKAEITALNAVSGKINVLEADSANIKNLLAGNLTGENIQAGGITSDKLTIANGFITNAMISNLDVLKLNAGDISTNKFRIVSDSGKMLIADNTIQISDNNRVRVQIGKDALNDYNMYVWDNAGKLMFDATGLKADGIKNKIIRDDMISDNANIDGSKLNISSLITEVNKDTNTSVIKSSKVQLDTLGQTLDIAFNSLKTQSDNNKSKTESNSTTISVMQGQISTAINNTQIVKDGQTILLKDDYNRTVSKVDSINSTLGSHKMLIDANSGNITNVDTKVNSVQRDLEGTKSIISSNSSRIDGLNSTVSNQGSSISQLQNQISLKVEQSDITTAVGKLQIGGRNLLPETSFKTSSPSWNKTSGATIDINSGKAKLVANGGDVAVSSNPIKELEPSTEYTLSVKVEDGNSIGGNGLRLYYKLNNVWKFIQIQSGFNGIAKTTFTTPQTITHKTQISFDSYNTTSGTCYVSNFKLEKGNKSTDWTPAPEDVDSAINGVQTQVTTTNNKVSTIETNLNSITSRVSATESTTATINGNITNLQSRMSTAEQKITATAIVNTVSETINNGTASINTVSTVLNKSGLSVYNGAFTLYDKFKNKVFYADSSGNVNFTGNLNPSSGMVNLFGNGCRIDGTASAIRMQLNPSNYISVTDKYVRVFNDYTVNNSRYGSLGTDSSGHFTIFNDRTMLKLLGGLSADAIIQARWASDTAYASFAGSDFYQRSTKEDKIMIDDINAVDVIDILKKNKIKQYALKANAEVICDQLGLEDVNLDNVVGVSADKKIGFILEDMTEEAKELITNNDVKSVNLYSMASMLWIIAQKQQEKIEELYKLLSLGN